MHGCGTQLKVLSLRCISATTAIMSKETATPRTSFSYDMLLRWMREKMKRSWTIHPQVRKRNRPAVQTKAAPQQIVMIIVPWG